MEEIVFSAAMETAPKVATHPQNQRVEDALLNHTHFTEEERDTLLTICDHYLATRYVDVIE